MCGPTASGKSARALDIAQEAGGVIINADAMQVYRELRIITARPTLSDEARAPHQLYGVLPSAESCSAAKWLALAGEAIEGAWRNGTLPIITGGTGLYLKALTEGLSPIPDTPEAARAEATRLYAEQGADALRERDPQMTLLLKDGDTQRHVRALEVWIATGKSLRYWQELPRRALFPEAEFTWEVLLPERAELYRRCDARFLLMLKEGALAEVAALAQLCLPTNLPAMRAVGVPELMAYVREELTLEAATTAAQQATRNYAKRQFTWFRNQI